MSDSQSKKQLRARRKIVVKGINQCRLSLLSSIEHAKKAANSHDQSRPLDMVEELNVKLQTHINEQDRIDHELKNRRHHPKSPIAKRKANKVRKGRKVHNVAGREVDPTGFRGVVSGGIPGGGKRR